MTALPNPKPDKMTEAEYLEFERNSEFKHEYLNGEIFAMVGASEVHNAIAMSTSFYLYAQLKDKPCKVYQSDMRVKAAELYTYPDIVVVCDDLQFTDDALDTLTNPIILIEVLSPSTERYDRGGKFQHYREIPSLKEYVLIAQDKPHIERFLRDDDKGWYLADVKGLDTEITLTSIGCILKMNEVYEQVDFEE